MLFVENLIHILLIYYEFMVKSYRPSLRRIRSNPQIVDYKKPSGFKNVFRNGEKIINVRISPATINPSFNTQAQNPYYKRQRPSGPHIHPGFWKPVFRLRGLHRFQS